QSTQRRRRDTLWCPTGPPVPPPHRNRPAPPPADPFASPTPRCANQAQRVPDRLALLQRHPVALAEALRAQTHHATESAFAAATRWKHATTNPGPQSRRSKTSQPGRTQTRTSQATLLLTFHRLVERV